MMIWESTLVDYFEYIGDIFYAVVGLKRDRTGWLARIERADTRQRWMAVFASEREAKRWVEQQIDTLRGPPDESAITTCLRVTRLAA